jgi:hypothetical protein
MATSFATRCWRVLWLSIAIAAGFLAGSADRPGPQTMAEVRRTPPREAFQGGDERSEVVLREIAATLTRIESRVERIEKSLAKGATDPQRQP